jgi:hypothetical protein
MKHEIPLPPPTFVHAVTVESSAPREDIAEAVSAGYHAAIFDAFAVPFIALLGVTAGYGFGELISLLISG